MKVKIFYETDEPVNEEWRDCSIPLEKRINDFIKDKKVIDIKYQSNLSGYANEYANDVADCERAVIIYEVQAIIKQKSFDSLDPNTKTDSLINDFLKKHDVINVEHFGGMDVDTVTTVITYKEHENENS